MSADDFADFERGPSGAKFGQSGNQSSSHGNSAGSYSDFDQDFGAEFSADDFAPPAPEAPAENDKFPPPFPLDGIDLLTPPGFAGDVAAWIDSQCRFPRRRLAVASALAALGNIGGLRHEDARDGVTANLLAFCVSASITRCE